jgi:hypothetical protein
MKLEQLRALERAATAGPWRQGDGGMVYGPDTMLVCNCFGWTSNHSTDESNARFVVASRDLVSALLKVAEAAQQVRAEWTNEHVVSTELDLKVVELIMALQELEAQ